MRITCIFYLSKKKTKRIVGMEFSILFLGININLRNHLNLNKDKIQLNQEKIKLNKEEIQ